MFAEEADRDLAAAEAGYREIIDRFDEERAYAGTAILRLAEMLDKRGEKEAAEKWFARVLQEFPDQEAVAKVARARLGDKAGDLAGASAAGARPLSEEEKSLAKVKKLAVESPDLLDSADESGWTPLAMAASNGQRKVVEFLIKQNVRLDAGGNHYRLWPLEQAVKGGHVDTIKLLIDAGAKVYPSLLQKSVRAGRYSVTKQLLEAGVDPNARPSSIALLPESRTVGNQFQSAFNRPGPTSRNQAVVGAYTPLDIACFFRFSKLIDLLLENGADAKGSAKHPSESLRYAIIDRDSALVEKLLKASADPNAVWLENVRPLHVAAKSGSAAIVQKLLDAGADISSVDARGNTALHFARGKVTPLLIEAGADLNAKKR